MRLLISIGFLGVCVLSSCYIKDNESQHKFAIRKKVETTYHYAKYRFALEGYEDVDIALKVAVQSGQAKTLWVKDLTTTTPLEEAGLTTNGLNFSGTSTGEHGGTYAGVLESGGGGEITGCCGTMTFVPSVADTFQFSGTKLEDLTKEQWEALLDTPADTASADTAQPTAPPPTIELGTQRVGVLFGITGARSVRRLEAHNSAGKVAGGLARWQTSKGNRIFAVEGTDNLFLTDAALTAGVTELIGFDDSDNRVLKANVSVAARDDSIVASAAYFVDGGYTWVAFSALPDPKPDDPWRQRDPHSNVYLSFTADMRVYDHSTGNLTQYSGKDSRGFWVGIRDFYCLVGGKVMAKVLNTVYTGTCLSPR